MLVHAAPDFVSHRCLAWALTLMGWLIVQGSQTLAQSPLTPAIQEADAPRSPLPRSPNHHIPPSHVIIPRSQLPAENLEAVFYRQLQQANGQAVVRERLAARDDLLKLAEALKTGDLSRLPAMDHKWAMRSEALGIDDPKLREVARRYLHERGIMEMAGRSGMTEAQREKLTELLRKLASDLEKGSAPGRTNDIHRPLEPQPPTSDPNRTSPGNPPPGGDLPLSPNHQQLLERLQSNPSFENVFRNILESSLSWPPGQTKDVPWMSRFHADLMPRITGFLGSGDFSIPMLDRAFMGSLMFPVDLDWRMPSPGGAVDMSFPDMGLPGIGPLPSDWAMGWPLFSVMAAIVVVVLVFRRMSRLRWNASGTQNSRWKLGTWPVAPTAVRLRAELISAFEYLAMLHFGAAACSWNHHMIADQLGNRKSDSSADRKEAAQRLAAIYEQARYAPPDEPIAESDLTSARRDLCLLAGVALS